MIQEDLDILLYAWLSEPDEHRAEQRFAQYFRAAFPEICRFVRSFRADAATAQDISQQALIKLFAHLGTERAAVDVRLRAALSELRPLDFGALHQRLVQEWRRQVRGFRDAAIAFRISHQTPQPAGAWKDLRDEINGRTRPLQRQGEYFLNEVRVRAASSLQAHVNPESTEAYGPQAGTAAARSRPGQAGGEDAEDRADDLTRAFVATLLQHAAGRDSTQVDSALGCAGAVGFVSRTNTVCEVLPALAIPSNGLLYTIAKRQYLDILRSKRGVHVELIPAVSDQGGRSVLDELDLESAFPADHPRETEALTNVRMTNTESQGGDHEGSVESRYRGFLEFLRLPLTRAEATLAEAASKGKAKAEHARVESLRRKHDRLMAVLGALHESPQPSEEEIARRQGLSRNQVKYVIERIREEFNYFFPDLAREAEGRRKRQGAET